LHPDICAFTSELFYDGRLHSRKGLEIQDIKSTGLIKGTGLRFIPVQHEGNQNSSPEEADRIRDLVNDIMDTSSTWVDRHGEEHTLTSDDILIIAPYNAQVFELQQRLPGARIGTVDKFQGQEAPIVVYSMTTSTHADAPRGMEFLYSSKRLNVATSRAKCICIIVASPALFEAECRTPRQMHLANAFCRYLELATAIYNEIPAKAAVGLDWSHSVNDPVSNFYWSAVGADMGQKIRPEEQAGSVTPPEDKKKTQSEDPFCRRRPAGAS
jgi:hypothetical protein